MLNRKYQQPLTLLPDFLTGRALQLEAVAEATSVDDLFARLESNGLMFRIDPNVAPTMFRGAVVSEPELALLRRVALDRARRFGFPAAATPKTGKRSSRRILNPSARS